MKLMIPAGLFLGGLSILSIEPQRIAAWLTCASLIAGAFIYLARMIIQFNTERAMVVRDIKEIKDTLCEGDNTFDELCERVTTIEATLKLKHARHRASDTE